MAVGGGDGGGGLEVAGGGGSLKVAGGCRQLLLVLRKGYKKGQKKAMTEKKESEKQIRKMNPKSEIRIRNPNPEFGSSESDVRIRMSAVQIPPPPGNTGSELVSYSPLMPSCAGDARAGEQGWTGVRLARTA